MISWRTSLPGYDWKGEAAESNWSYEAIAASEGDGSKRSFKKTILRYIRPQGQHPVRALYKQLMGRSQMSGKRPF